MVRTSVLIVEDNREVARVYEAWLANDFDVTVTFRGADAIDILAESDHDILILDRRLPDMDGDAVLASLEARGYTGYCIMITGTVPNLDIIDLSIDGYLTKPITKQELIQTIARLQSVGVYDMAMREYYSLVQKKAVLTAHGRFESIDNIDEFEMINEQIERIRGQISRVGKRFESGEYRALYKRIRQ